MPSSSPADLRVVTNRTEVRKAFRLLRKELRKGATRIERTVGFRGGSTLTTLLWHPENGFWALLDEGADLNHHWCAYGIETEPASASLSIVCEINPPHQGVNRRCAGIFLQDSDGRFYLAHTGKVGGGRKGIGKEAFTRLYDGALESLRWPDGKTDEVAVIGRIGAPRFPSQLGRFVGRVQHLKATATKDHVLRTDSTVNEYGFTPEFRGQRAAYQHDASVESRCDHGLVVDALKAALEREGIRGLIGNDKHRDLFIVTPRRSKAALFEVKTDTSPTSAYTGVGQLMLHGARTSSPPARILVLPGAPVAATKAALKRLGIEVLVYRWVDSLPRFSPSDVTGVLAD